MLRPLTQLTFALGLLALTVPAAAQEKLTKVEIARRGKAATAFLEAARGRTGTAFCVHPTGLFVTNDDVVRGVDKEAIQLVLNPALDGQRVLKAKVVQADQSLGLALLRVEGAADLPSLPLGSIKDVAELTAVVACGFPRGVPFAAAKKNYPAISVSAGSVAALHYKDRELQHLQIDVAATFATSGGPLLDEYGKVIGVLASGIGFGRKGFDKVVPVSQLAMFLMKPALVFVPPTLTRAALAKPLEFQASASALVPEAPLATLKLMLQADEDEPLAIPMKQQGKLWVATATLGAQRKTARVEITARIGTASVTGTTDDLAFEVAGKPRKLSEVRRIDFKDKPGIVLADGRTVIEGKVAGLGVVEIDLAGQKVKLDLAKATAVTVQAAPQILSVLASVIALVDGKEVARSEARMLVQDAVAPPRADPATVKITPSTQDEERTIKRLPELFSEVKLGGGGRYFIFHLPKLKKLGVFDVNEARVTRYIALSEDDIAYAASLNALVIGFKKAGTLERWNLTTFELEKTAVYPHKDALVSVVMGHGSHGPVIVNGYFFDLETFQPLPIVDQNGNARTSVGGNFPSGDGTVFTGWNTHYSPSSSASFVLEGGALRRYEGGELMHVIPGPDGRTLYTGRGIVNRNMTRLDASEAVAGYSLPAVRGDYFLTLSSAEANHGGGFTVYLRGLKEPIAKLDKANHGLRFDGWDREHFGPWKRVFLIPDAKLIVVLPAGNDQVVLHKFDADAALEKSGQNYLLVTSRPPQTVVAGTTFAYAVKTKSKQGGVTFRLDSGPKDMTVAADGTVTWTVPASIAAGNQDVILTVRDKSGQEVFHNFTLQVVK